MKIVLMLLIFGLVGCGPKFKRGDCVVDDFSSDFETRKQFIRIRAVGQNDYLIKYSWYDMQGPWNGTTSIYSLDNSGDRTFSSACPKLDGKK